MCKVGRSVGEGGLMWKGKGEEDSGEMGEG